MRLRVLMVLKSNQTLPAALLLSGSLLFYLPLSIAVDNTVFFIFSSAQLALGLLAAWVLVGGVLAGLGALLAPHARCVWGAILAGAAVLAWLQGWFLTREYWELHWWLPPQGRIKVLSIDTLSAAAIFIAAFAVYLRWRAESARFLWLVNLGLALWTCALIAAAPGKPHGLQRPDDLSRFSEKGNVVVILFDAFQGDLFGEILDHHPELRAHFDGFTYYRDASGVAASTHLSIPTIHSGLVYQDGASIRAFYREGVEADSFMTGLAQSGYVGTYVNPMMDSCPRGLAWCGHEAVIHDGLPAVYAREAALLVDVAMRRTLPAFLRDRIYGNAGFDPDIHDRIRKGVVLLRGVTRDLQVDSGPPRVKFLHLMSTHAPIKLDEDCRPSRGRHWVRDDMRRPATCSVKELAGFLQALRRHGLYDQSTVVVLADHGSGLAPRAGGDDWSQKSQLLNGIADVLLLVKPRRAQGALQSSWQPVDLRDISTTVCADTGACPAGVAGKPLLAAHGSGPPRDREFMFYPWWFGKWTKDRMVVPERYRIAGRRGDPQAWRREPPKPVQDL